MTERPAAAPGDIEPGDIEPGAEPVAPVPAVPVVPRPAASLLVLRPGPEVLMGVRGAGHRFMPNLLVFPGGAVDPGDDAAPAASEPTPATLAQLGRDADGTLARALAAAAARELVEETGLSLGAPPHLAPLRYLCRAVTPPSQPIRFNARFLVVDAGHVSGTLAGSGELENLAWFAPGDLLGLDVALVTREVLRQLQAWLELTPAEQDGRARLPVFSRKNWTEE